MSEETIVEKHMKILREGYKNNKAQMLQAKEQAEAQLEQATKTIEIIEGELATLEGYLNDIEQIVGPEEEEE
tara:strand:+ start:471 stop:686 length:216 start_codon:yes stop_codon:yes gene_type:complete